MRRITFVALSSALVVASACAHAPTPAFQLNGRYGPEVEDAFGKARAATARFVSIDSAVAAGYPREVQQCLASGRGGMGHHHINRTYVDKSLDVEHPEILLYDKHNGHYRLNGVEYIVPYRLWPKDSVAPVLMGQNLRRADDLDLWYLHMWIWTENKVGLFADWNPAVECETKKA